MTVPSFIDVGLPVPMWAAVGALLSFGGTGIRLDGGGFSAPYPFGAGRPVASRRRRAPRAGPQAPGAPAARRGAGRISGAGAFGAIRIVHLGLLAVLALVLARLLPLHQYGLWTRGSFFSNLYTMVMLLGQDQLVMQRRLPMRHVRFRGLLILALVSAVTLPIAALTLSAAAFTVVCAASLSTAGMVVVYGELSRLMALGLAPAAGHDPARQRGFDSARRRRRRRVRS